MSRRHPLAGRFPGGCHLQPRKAPANARPIGTAGLPGRLVYPLRQRDGNLAKPCVAPGDTVRRGDRLAGGSHPLDPPIHAATSGTLVAIVQHPQPFREAPEGPCLVLAADGEDRPAPPLPPLDPQRCTREALIRRAQDAGITGHGGAVFPTAAKLAANPAGAHTLIVNGVECEPYLSCDDRLLRERAEAVARGAALLQRCFGVELAVIAVEADMPEALASLEQTLDRLGLRQLRVAVVPARYPAGSERQLIQTLTGREIPAAGRPADLGILSLNAATCAALQRAAVLGEIPVSRIVTVAGGGVRQPQNLEVRFGTPLAQLIAACGGPAGPVERLLIGGPLTGYPAASDAVPVSPSVNAVLVAAPGELPAVHAPEPCIRCGACTEVCPARLLPEELFRILSGGRQRPDAGRAVLDCIECGLCDAVCPSHIPLVAHFRRGKAALHAERLARARAEQARQRHEARLARKAREQAEREQATQRRRSQLAQGGSPNIQAALARARQKRAGTAPAPEDTDDNR